MKKKILSQFQLFLIIGFVIISNYSCDPTTEKPKQLAVLTTKTITDISYHSAVCGGIITSDNGLEVTVRGVCWSLKPNPTINDSITKDAAGTGEFTSNISNLIADTTYYLRAYATNSDGTAYGLQITFKTLATALPTLSTTIATNITETTASSGGDISSDGGSEITARGVCWSLTENPTISNNKTNDGVGVGNYTSNLTNLTDGTKYFVRAYATNSIGTSYGEQISINTKSLFPSNGLVAWFPFNGNTNDESGNGNNAINEGANLTSNRFDQTNSAYDFDLNNASFSKKNDQISIPYNSVYNSNLLSVSIWLQPRSYYWTGNALHWSIPICRYENGSFSNTIWGVKYTDISVSAFIRNSVNSHLTVENSQTLNLNNWSNIIFTYDGSVLKLYINGVLKSQVAGQISNINSNVKSGITIGEFNESNGYWYYTDGKIDDVGIWNRALSQQEITNVYNQKE